MPYENINELPKSVRNLPSRAKTIYMKAFNSAWDEYADAEDDLAREKDSHEAAWSAVKEEYKKDEETGEWVKISDDWKTHPPCSQASKEQINRNCFTGQSTCMMPEKADEVLSRMLMMRFGCPSSAI